MSASDRHLRHEWNDGETRRDSMGTADVFGKSVFKTIYLKSIAFFKGTSVFRVESSRNVP
jgi:hypothetical protein